jgi:hypothetical protein
MKKIMFLMMFVGLFWAAASDASAQNCRPKANQVALFEDWKYQGNCVLVDAGELYNVEDVGFPNDNLSSILFGRNVASVELCEDVNLGGKCQTFYKSVGDFSKLKIGNDTVSSMRINLK